MRRPGPIRGESPRPVTTPPRGAGFTLLEVLVALAIFAVIGVAAYTGLFAVLDARAATRAQSERLAAVQYAVDTLAGDLRQAVARPVRAAQPRERAPLYSPGANIEPLFAVTRGGWPNPAGLTRSSLARVRWQLEGERLERSWHARVDATAGAAPVRRLVLDRVAAVELRFLADDGEWTERWPPLNTGSVDPGLPRAVEVRLELADWGEVRRLFALPQGAAPAPPEAPDG